MTAEHERHMELMMALGRIGDELSILVMCEQQSSDEAAADDLYAEVERRTAERLYAVRLGMLAQIDPINHPSSDTLVDLARHCWQAARILADAKSQEWAKLHEADGVDLSKPFPIASLDMQAPTPLVPDPKI